MLVVPLVWTEKKESSWLIHFAAQFSILVYVIILGYFLAAIWSITYLNVGYAQYFNAVPFTLQDFKFESKL